MATHIIVKSADSAIKDEIIRTIFLNFSIDEEKVTIYAIKEPFATLLKHRLVKNGRVAKTNLEHFIPLRESIDKYWDRSKFNYAVFSQAILETNNQFQYNGMYRY